MVKQVVGVVAASLFIAAFATGGHSSAGRPAGAGGAGVSAVQGSAAAPAGVSMKAGESVKPFSMVSSGGAQSAQELKKMPVKRWAWEVMPYWTPDRREGC